MTEKYNLSQFLAQYPMKSTYALYKSIIRCYLRTLYPELKKSDDEKRYDEFSLQYVSTPRDFRGDLLRFRDQTKDDAGVRRKLCSSSYSIYYSHAHSRLLKAIL
jgi:hypothetical protein